MALAGGAAAGGDPTDDRVRMRVDRRLAGQVAIHFERLRISVEDGTVTLAGSVASIGEKQTAERIVSGVAGVVSVVNELDIRATTRSDAAVEDEARRLLDTRARFRDRGIGVSVAGAIVTLRGEVERALDRRDAETIVAAIPGVAEVRNQLIVRSEGSVPDDLVRSRVLSLLVNPLTFGVIEDLVVEVSAGTVTLGGRARRDADRREAERLALVVTGVARVVNRITVP